MSTALFKGSSNTSKIDSVREKWFSDFLSTLQIHQARLETKTAGPELEQFYNTVIGASTEDLMHLQNDTSKKYFFILIITNYLELIAKKPIVKIAFDMSNTNILVWAEINDDDEVTEDFLIMSEAKINSKFYEKGFNIITTIVETSDNCDIPSQYQQFKLS